jgi:hypothetical protein
MNGGREERVAVRPERLEVKRREGQRKRSNSVFELTAEI